jgi:hypothetical protein
VTSLFVQDIDFNGVINGSGNITTTGYVGIGTESPTHALNVVGDANVTGDLFVNGINVTGNLVDNYYSMSDVDNMLSGNFSLINTDLDVAIAGNISLINTDLANAIESNKTIIFQTADANYSALYEALNNVVSGNKSEAYGEVYGAVDGNISLVNTDINGAINGNVSLINTDINSAIDGNKTEIYGAGNGNYSEIYGLITGNYTAVEGSFNSTGWNRSGTNVFLANDNDYVGIGTTTPSSLLETANVAGTNEVNLSGVMYVNSTSGNVGVGTSSPLYNLHIKPSSGGSTLTIDTSVADDSSLLFSNNGAVKWKLRNDNGGTMGTDGLILTDKDNEELLGISQTNNFWFNGSVGIGETAPSSLLTTGNVDGTNEVNLSGVLYINSTSGNVGIGTGTPQQTLNVEGTFNATDDSYIAGNVFVNESNFGIGTNSPLSKFDIQRDPAQPAATGTATTAFLRLKSSGTTAADFGLQGASPYGLWIQSTAQTDLSTTYPISLNPNGGRVGIGTVNPQQTLDVVGNANVTQNLSIGSALVFIDGSGNMVFKI